MAAVPGPSTPLFVVVIGVELVLVVVWLLPLSLSSRVWLGVLIS